MLDKLDDIIKIASGLWKNPGAISQMLDMKDQLISEFDTLTARLAEAERMEMGTRRNAPPPDATAATKGVSMGETRLSERVRVAFGKAQRTSREYNRVTGLTFSTAAQIDEAARAADEAESERDAVLAEIDALAARLGEAERERGEADDALAACRSEANGQIAALKADVASGWEIILGTRAQYHDLRGRIRALERGVQEIRSHTTHYYGTGHGDDARVFGGKLVAIRTIVDALLSAAPATTDAGEGRETTYPCEKCGKLRTKAEGGTTFLVCEQCWDEFYNNHPTPPATEGASEGGAK